MRFYLCFNQKGLSQENKFMLFFFFKLLLHFTGKAGGCQLLGSCHDFYLPGCTHVRNIWMPQVDMDARVDPSNIRNSTKK
jgi:hypothetical protein